MTIASETAKSGPYSGDGSTTTFTVGFYFLSNGDLTVTRRNADGSETALALGTDYSVAGAGNPAGGSVTCTAAPASGMTITITRHVAKVQGLSLPDGGVFSSAALEQKLDYITMEIQQLNERVDRRPGLLVSSMVPAPKLADPSANAALVYSSDGTAIEPGPTTTQIASAQTYATNAAASAAIAVAAAGYKYTYSTSTIAADPGAGNIAFDNATLSSATKLYISETTGNAQPVASDIATWDDQSSLNKGRIRIFKQSDPTVFALFNVTGSNTDHGSWNTVNLSYVGSGGLLSNGDSLTVEFFQAGDKGDTGATGPTGPAGTVPISAAGGTSDAITGSYSPNLTLVDKTVCIIIPAADNATSTPTFSPDGLTPHMITKTGGAALVAGDVKSLHPALLEYNAANTRWELMNPVYPPAQTGDVVTTGAAATIQPQVVSYSKIQNVSATSRVMGRKTAGAGSLEECTLSQVLDFIGSAAQGDILYRDSGGWARLGAGASGNFLKTQGAGANPVWAAAAGGAIDIQTFTASGTWTKPSSGTWAYVQAWGAGGSGASSVNTSISGAGGGGGAYAEGWFLLASFGVTEIVTVGAGGVAIFGTSTNGNVGGNSLFGSWLTAYGGGPGLQATTNAGGGSGGGTNSVGAIGVTSSQTGSAGGGPLGGNTAVGTQNLGINADRDGGGGAPGSNGAAGGNSNTGGAGGGASSVGSAAGGGGGNSNFGGGGGGGATSTGTRGMGGSSKAGGNGGQGGNVSNNGLDGSQPSGGGGGAMNGKTSGKGGDGKVVVIVI